MREREDQPRREPLPPLETLDPEELSEVLEARARARREERRRGRGPRGPRLAGSARSLLQAPAGRVLLACAVALALATIVGLIALWPGARHTGRSEALGGKSLSAQVTSARTVRCPGPTVQRCRRIQVRLGEGPDRGRRSWITLGPLRGSPVVAVGSHVRVDRIAGPVPAGAAPPGGFERYGFEDFDRRGSLLWLAIGFGALAVLLARWRGALALLGFALSLVLVTKFLVPAILAGSSPLLVSLVGGLAVMFVTVVLTYGVGASSLAAALGIAASLLLAGGLGDAWVHVAKLNGFSSDLAPLLQQSAGSVSLQAIVIAGMVIGSLGVLTDMAVTQASAVVALRRANPALGGRHLYQGAFAVGRDHLSATIHTLVLAYVGAALPLLLVLQRSGVSFTDAVNSQDVAEPIVATLVGSIALIASVPITTGLAAMLAARVPPGALPGGHVHHH